MFRRKRTRRYIPKVLAGFFITTAEQACRPWGGFDLVAVRRQLRYAFHNNRIPAESSGSDETLPAGDQEGDSSSDGEEDEEAAGGDDGAMEVAD